MNAAFGVLFLAWLSACSGTELAVPTSHPGHAQARSGKLLDTHGLSSAFDASAGAAPATSGGHEQHHAENHDHSAHDESAAGNGGAADLRYTCPMHPEVEQSAPGNCPKCGMKLVPKKEEN